MMVYLVWYESGVYEDYERSLVGICASREVAEHRAEEVLSLEYQSYIEDLDEEISFEEWMDEECVHTYIRESEVREA